MKEIILNFGPILEIKVEEVNPIRFKIEVEEMMRIQFEIREESRKIEELRRHQREQEAQIKAEREAQIKAEREAQARKQAEYQRILSSQPRYWAPEPRREFVLEIETKSGLVRTYLESREFDTFFPFSRHELVSLSNNVFYRDL
jgi:hypothetical protein